MDNHEFEAKVWAALKRHRGHGNDAQTAGEIFAFTNAFAVSYARQHASSAEAEKATADAARYFADTWAELLGGMLQDEYGCWMQCGEANAAVDLYRALGDEQAARQVLFAHAFYDTEEEQHYYPRPGNRPLLTMLSRQPAADCLYRQIGRN